MLVIAGCSQVLFEDGVDPFGWFISLRMIRCSEVLVDAKRGSESFPQAGGKQGIYIHDYFVREAVQVEDISHE